MTSAPGGISCGANCSEPYSIGTTVTLTTEPTPGYRFGSWTSCPSPSGATCTVLMTQDQTVTATFIHLLINVDFNADGRPDLVAQNRQTGEVYLWFMDGTTHTDGRSLGTVADQDWQIVGIGDFGW